MGVKKLDLLHVFETHPPLQKCDVTITQRITFAQVKDGFFEKILRIKGTVLLFHIIYNEV